MYAAGTELTELLHGARKAWWEGKTLEPAPAALHEHDLLVIRQPDQALQSEAEPGPSRESKVMQEEIQDFRRALEYVGELVRQLSGDLENEYSSQDSGHKIGELHHV
ncbi:hypothetical protein BBP40_007527 [Aspergillus hancockii]|nr:hypothetical protein BBP40_007527 [Aspergillus hancockii]